MIKFLPLIIAGYVSLAVSSECNTGKIENRYALPGKYGVKKEIFFSKNFGNKEIHMFLPDGIKKNIPLIFFFPRNGSNGPQEYRELIDFIVSKGYGVLFPPSYAALDLKRRDFEKDGSKKTLLSDLTESLKNRIDTTRVGFVAHGYGAGVVPAIAKKVINQGWGANGVLMNLLSPGYFHGLDIRELENYPSNTHLMITAFEEDNINDPVIGKELFLRISIPTSQKEWYYIPDARNDKCQLVSDFIVPFGVEGIGGEINNLDYYGIHAPLGAALDGVFNSDTAAYSFAFGNGTQRPLSMGKWSDGVPLPFMIGTDFPEPYLNRRHAVNMWISGRNSFADVSEFRRKRKFAGGSIGNKISRAGEFLGDKIFMDKDGIGRVTLYPNPIKNGYGAPGAYSIEIDSVANPLTEHKVRLFTPKGVTKKIPLIVLLHGYSGPDYRFFQPLITHLVSHGNAVLFPPYPGTPAPTSEERVVGKYTIIRKGMEKAFEKWQDQIDTSRIIVSGQSFGGGMVPAISHDLLVKKGWGKNGAGLFVMAPWYTYEITDSMYMEFPKHTNLVVQVYDEDKTNDHEMGVDLFNSLPVPDSQKDFMILYSDEFEEEQMIANHFVPYGTWNIYGDENLLDYYGVYRPFQALASYTFDGDTLAYPVALGGGDPEQTFMGFWSENRPFTPCRVTDKPFSTHPQLKYLFSWEAGLNPRSKK